MVRLRRLLFQACFWRILSGHLTIYSYSTFYITWRYVSWITTPAQPVLRMLLRKLIRYVALCMFLDSRICHFSRGRHLELSHMYITCIGGESRHYRRHCNQITKSEMKQTKGGLQEIVPDFLYIWTPKSQKGPSFPVGAMWRTVLQYLLSGLEWKPEKLSLERMSSRTNNLKKEPGDSRFQACNWIEIRFLVPAPLVYIWRLSLDEKSVTLPVGYVQYVVRSGMLRKRVGGTLCSAAWE